MKIQARYFAYDSFISAIKAAVEPSRLVRLVVVVLVTMGGGKQNLILALSLPPLVFDRFTVSVRTVSAVWYTLTAQSSRILSKPAFWAGVCTILKC